MSGCARNVEAQRRSPDHLKSTLLESLRKRLGLLLSANFGSVLVQCSLKLEDRKHAGCRFTRFVFIRNSYVGEVKNYEQMLTIHVFCIG